MKLSMHRGATMDVFCGWGEAADVGINLVRNEEEAKAWKDSHLHFYVDLTAAEARRVAAKLIEMADQAEELDRLLEEHTKQWTIDT